MAAEYEKVYVEDVPLEDAKRVLSAVIEYLGATLERRQPGYGDPDQYRLVKK